MSYETKIKICFVAREYAHEQMGKTGGIGVFLKKFAHELQSEDFLVTVFSFGERSVKFDDSGITVVKIRDLTRLNEFIKSPFRAYGIPGYITLKNILEFFNRLYISLYLSIFVKKHKFDLMEFHDYGGDAPYFVGSLPKVVRCHGSAITLHEFMGYYKRQPDAYYEAVFFKRFYKHVVAVSQYSAKITQQAFALKVTPKVIYNGVTVKAPLEGSSYFDLPTEAFSVYYFGSIRERKGIDIACRVFNVIVDRFPKASFHVMGNNNNDHWHTNALPILTEQAAAKTTYYGMIPNETVSKYLKRAHVVLFPSYGENFSVGLLEVMALGKLVVTSDIPAFREILESGDNGYIAQSHDDYISLISAIFNKEIDIEYVSRNAFKTVKNNFSSRVITKENVTYYKSLIS